MKNAVTMLDINVDYTNDLSRVTAALKGITANDAQLNHYKQNMTSALVRVISTLRDTETDNSDALECATLDMLGALDPTLCVSKARDNVSYRTFSTMFRKLCKPVTETLATETLSGYDLSIKLEWASKEHKEKGDPKKFVVGARYISVARHELAETQRASDTALSDKHEQDQAKLEKKEQVQSRIAKPTAERDAMVLESVFEMFPDKPALDTLRELMERAVTDTVLDEKAA